MAYITETTNSFGASIAAAVTSATSAVAAFMTDLGTANARSQMLRELQGMDDATLKSTHGITRSEIITYVFGDRLLP